jgi:tRNA pseudouridine55 synthase
LSAAAAPPRTPPTAVAPPWSGLLAVDKPAGMTSHDVVEVARRRLRAPGAGHLGTLDPGATGLLLLALGAATRCIPVWQGGEKTYEATLRFGVVTSTQDMQGEVLERRPVDLDEARVRAASLAFVGDLEQVPPMVSALQVGGERLYRIARRGEVVERAPRPVRVSEWTWNSFALPEARFRVRCSGGTYVRTLAHDLGARLGCGAALQALRRLRSEPFGLEHAIAPRDLDLRSPEEVLATAGIPLDEALCVLPALTLDDAAIERVGHGQRPSLEQHQAVAAGVPLGAGPRSVVARDPNGRSLALGEVVADPASPGRTIFCPRVVFPWAVRQGRG